ncbi:MAG: lytic murein transglycosylase [Desulfobacterales bacterium]|nr:lytic murein transglycosylase [Desulfobacterales bacterium]
MKTATNIIKKCALIFFLILYSVATDTHGAEDSQKKYFEALKKKLITDGFDKKQIEDIYSKKNVGFEPMGIYLFFVHREVNVNYDQFSSKSSIKKAKTYAKTHKKILSYAEKEFGVDKNVIVAIILVETRLGKLLGSKNVFNTLSTMAAISEKSARDTLWELLPEKERLSRTEYDAKADAKSQWAYDELKALIEYSSKENVDIASLRGSYAGAMGIPQFLPSSIIKHAKDGNSDGRIDMFDNYDAIVSVASYLKNYGWTKNIKREDAKSVIFNYNRSCYYVDAILKVADLLKGK